jgi:cullin 3
VGIADLRAVFGKEKHELNVSTHQMCILMLFNATDTLSYNDILQSTCIPAPELKRALQSMACVKVIACFCPVKSVLMI